MNKKNYSSLEVIKETFGKSEDFYLPLLLINSPNLVFTLIIGFFQVSYPNLAILSLLSFVSVIVSSWYTTASYIYCYKRLNGQNITVQRAFRDSLSKIINMFIAIILTFLFIIIGLLLLIIPGIYIGVRLNLTFYVIAVENCSVLDALKRSWRLTKGNSNFVFATLLLMGLGIIIAIFIMSFIMGAILAIILGDTETLKVVSNLLGSVLGYLFVPIYFIIIAIIYDRLNYGNNLAE
ncbi:glycerophosphoryl diester phosphodiesterase membrane domain-containing protein [Cyanobacterium aponinum]|uniref:Glycerophosphoryl diester phosphodiesterase membrane domain-containing protein n=1 Tax=Cyanobacterium aponinum 0216 TaxID=2676140 RepID=A0A844GT58_9CHRO|nr:glycerophosphoryl diester phosphodiesterase membrane domain-containing protein [Cyanobacterium aponinum]MTF38089.1 hypothetical protein [Cyanobacterium aponinum 0216]